MDLKLPLPPGYEEHAVYMLEHYSTYDELIDIVELLRYVEGKKTIDFTDAFALDRMLHNYLSEKSLIVYRENSFGNIIINVTLNGLWVLNLARK